MSFWPQICHKIGPFRPQVAAAAVRRCCPAARPTIALDRRISIPRARPFRPRRQLRRHAHCPAVAQDGPMTKMDCVEYADIRVALDWRRRTLGMSMEDLDYVSGVTSGYSSKLICGMRNSWKYIASLLARRSKVAPLDFTSITKVKEQHRGNKLFLSQHHNPARQIPIKSTALSSSNALRRPAFAPASSPPPRAAATWQRSPPSQRITAAAATPLWPTSPWVPRRSRCEKRHSATVNELSRLRHQAVAEPRADLHKPNRLPTAALVWPVQGRRSTALP